MPEVKIILTAEQKQAVAAFNQFRERVNVGKDALQSMANAGRAFGSQIAPQITAGVSAVSEAFKALAGSARLGSAAIGAYAIGAGVVFLGWKKAIDDVRASLKKFDDDVAAKKADSDWQSRRAALLGYVETLQKANRLTGEQARQLTSDILTAATPEQRSTVSNRLGSTINVEREKIENEKVEAAAELEGLLRDLQIKLLDGAERQKAEVQKEIDELISKGAEAAAKLGISSQPLNDLATQLSAKQFAEIDTKEAEKKVEAQRKQLEESRKITQEIRDRERRADEFYKREDEHQRRMVEAERQKNIQSIQRNPFLTESERFGQLQSAGMDTSSEGLVDPNNFASNFLAQLTALQSAIGTFSQASAGLITTGLGTAMQGVTDSIMSVIERTGNMGQIWQSVTRQMTYNAVQFSVQQLTAFVTSMARRVIAHIAGEQEMTAATVTGSATRGAATKKEGLTAGFKLASKAASAVADIPVVGWAFAIAAFASVMAMVVAASSIGFEEGGFTGRGRNNEVAGVVHRNEFVMPADAVDRIGVGNLEAMRAGAMPISVEPSGSSGSAIRSQNVAVFFDRDMLVNYLKENSDTIVVDAVKRNRAEIGLPT